MRSDEAVMVQAAKRNPAEFGVLYEHYREQVYSYLLACTKNVEDAADLTQQVFLQALDALHQYQPHKGSFLAWLFGIAHNAAVNFLRRHRTTMAWNLVPEMHHPTVELDVEAEIVQREATDRLYVLLNALDQQKRELIALRYVVGLTTAEIAVVVGKSEAATKKQLTRILYTLKEQYYGTKL